MDFFHVGVRDSDKQFALTASTPTSLYGLSLAQAYIYFRTYDDNITLKLTVVLLWSVLDFYAARHEKYSDDNNISALQTAQVAMSFHFQYAQLILSFNQPETLLKIPW